MGDASSKIRLLAGLRVLCLKAVFDTWYGEDCESEINLMHVDNALRGLKAVGTSLGVTIYSQVLPNSSALDTLVSMILDMCFKEDPISKEIEELYGKKMLFLFNFTQWIFATSIFSSLLSIPISRDIPEERKSFIIKERQIAKEFIKETPFYIDDHKNFIDEILGKEISAICIGYSDLIRSGSLTKSKFHSIHSFSHKVTHALVPYYGDIMDRIEIADSIKLDLKKCKPGTAYWEQYEAICLKSLRFLFTPPFKQVLIQARSTDNHERRDAVLPNNIYSGFWHHIRQEFDCRHIICEFKNGRNNNKDSLNQIRIYLSKPTIGRFGILFIRNPPNNSLLQAQRYAYEHQRILVIVLDDKKLSQLLDWRAFTGDAEGFLEDEKIRFEINY